MVVFGCLFCCVAMACCFDFWLWLLLIVLLFRCWFAHLVGVCVNYWLLASFRLLKFLVYVLFGLLVLVFWLVCWLLRFLDGCLLADGLLV